MKVGDIYPLINVGIYQTPFYHLCVGRVRCIFHFHIDKPGGRRQLDATEYFAGYGRHDSHDC